MKPQPSPAPKQAWYITINRHCMLSPIKVANNLGQGGTCRCSCSGIWEKKINSCQRTRIISVSFSSIQPALMKSNSCFAVQRIGVSVSNTRSFAKCDLGVGKGTVWPSKRSNNENHLKKIISADSAPTHAKLLLAWIAESILHNIERSQQKCSPAIRVPFHKDFNKQKKNKQTLFNEGDT